jgi:hypothetical protein
MNDGPNYHSNCCSHRRIPDDSQHVFNIGLLPVSTPRTFRYTRERDVAPWVVTEAVPREFRFDVPTRLRSSRHTRKQTRRLTCGETRLSLPHRFV